MARQGGATPRPEAPKNVYDINISDAYEAYKALLAKIEDVEADLRTAIREHELLQRHRDAAQNSLPVYSEVNPRTGEQRHVDPDRPDDAHIDTLAGEIRRLHGEIAELRSQIPEARLAAGRALRLKITAPQAEWVAYPAPGHNAAD